MAGKMSKRERIEATLRRQPTDRPPVSFWRHFYRQERSAEGLARAMVDWQRTYDWDFVKFNPRASYHVEDWGNRYRWSDDDLTPHSLDWFRVKEAEDWHRLEELDPAAGVLGEHLEALRLTRKELGPEVPIVMTVFTPLSIAGRLAGGEQRMRQHLAEHPGEVESALERIAEVFAGFAWRSLEAGADGLFFATTKWAATDMLSPDEYQRWGRPFDLRILEAVREAPFNVLHVCGSNNLLKSLVDYPVQALNWDATDPTNPDLEETKRLTEKALIGGITQALTSDGGARERLVEEARRAREVTGGLGWMLGAGCVLPTDALEENMRALRNLFAEPA